MKTNDTNIAEVYLHIGNGGVTFAVLQAERVWEFEGEPQISKAPVLEISAGHMGHQTNNMRIQLSPEALRTLGEAFITASKRVVAENEHVLVENPRHVRFGNTDLRLGLPEAAQTCSG